MKIKKFLFLAVILGVLWTLPAQVDMSAMLDRLPTSLIFSSDDVAGEARDNIRFVNMTGKFDLSFTVMVYKNSDFGPR